MKTIANVTDSIIGMQLTAFVHSGHVIPPGSDNDVVSLEHFILLRLFNRSASIEFW